MLLQNLNASAALNSKHNVVSDWRLRKVVYSHYTRAVRKHTPNAIRRLISTRVSNFNKENIPTAEGGSA